MSRHLPPPGPLDVRRTALFLDLDGTLAGIEDHPEKVRPEARRNRLLARASRALVEMTPTRRSSSRLAPVRFNFICRTRHPDGVMAVRLVDLPHRGAEDPFGRCLFA